MSNHKEKPEIPSWVHIGCKVIWKGYEWTVTDIGDLSRTVELNGDERLRASVREIQKVSLRIELKKSLCDGLRDDALDWVPSAFRESVYLSDAILAVEGAFYDTTD